MTLVTGHLEDNQGGGGHRDYTRLDVVKIPLVEDSVAKISESDHQGAGVGKDPQQRGEGQDFLLPDDVVLQQSTLVEEDFEIILQRGWSKWMTKNRIKKTSCHLIMKMTSCKAWLV